MFFGQRSIRSCSTPVHASYNNWRVVLSILIVFGIHFGFTTSQVQSEVLKAGINHSLRLDAVKSGLRQGDIFSESSLPASGTKLEWYRVPRWMSGSWKKTTQSAVVEGRLHQVNCLSSGYHGLQVDRNGRIWDCSKVPFKSLAEYDHSFTIGLVRTYDPVSVSKDQVIVHVIATNISVDKRTKKIVDVGQADQLQYYAPNPRGGLDCKVSGVRFDQDGNRLAQAPSFTFSTSSQIGSFEPVDKDPEDNTDYYKSFCQYLAEHGMREAIPTRLPGEPWISSQ